MFLLLVISSADKSCELCAANAYITSSCDGDPDVNYAGGIRGTGQGETDRAFKGLT